MILGFIGTGNIACALVDGLCAGESPVTRIVVSPRNAERARRLASRHAAVTVGSDNQAVADAADLLVLSVRPGQAPATLAALHLRPGQQVVSLMATLPIARLAPVLAPGVLAQRAVPLPAAARRSGPVLVYPHVEALVPLWRSLGTPVAAGSEDEFEVLWSLTALISPWYALLDDLQRWCLRHGARGDTAVAYLPALFECLSRQAAEAPGEGAFATLAREAQTPGGINEQAMRLVREAGAYAGVLAALDAVVARLRAASTA